VELRDIEIFLTLAEELHFGRTADRLHVTPARVSQAIKKQERAIGAALFERTSRVVRLTPIGEQMRDDLELGYRQIRQAIGGAAAAVRGIGGTVRVGFSGPWCGDLIIKAAEVFRDRYPACAVKVVERLLADRFGALRAGEIDMQLTELPTDEPDIANGPILFRERRALQVPLGHPLAARASVTLEDYGDCDVITLENVPDYFLDYHMPRRTPSGRPIQRGLTAISFQEVQSLVGAGKGVQPLALRAAAFHSRPDTVIVPFDDAPPIEYGFTWLADGETAKIQAFVRTVLDVAGRDGCDGLDPLELEQNQGPYAAPDRP
jgi:DNA-binding transcriptional LysR family regulator